MESKRDFFNRIKNPINEFLENMDKLCISDYVPSKVKINRDIHFNEHNIERVISNVEDYNKFIYDLDKVSSETHKKSTIISKDDDKNKIDINAYKISNLKKEIIPSSFFKTDLKTTGHSQDFDDIMKNKAEEILNKINQMSEVIVNCIIKVNWEKEEKDHIVIRLLFKYNNFNHLNGLINNLKK